MRTIDLITIHDKSLKDKRRQQRQDLYGHNLLQIKTSEKFRAGDLIVTAKTEEHTYHIYPCLQSCNSIVRASVA